MEDEADGRSMYDIFADLEIEEQEEEVEGGGGRGGCRGTGREEG